MNLNPVLSNPTVFSQPRTLCITAGRMSSIHPWCSSLVFPLEETQHNCKVSRFHRLWSNWVWYEHCEEREQRVLPLLLSLWRLNSKLLRISPVLVHAIFIRQIHGWTDCFPTTGENRKPIRWMSELILRDFIFVCFYWSARYWCWQDTVSDTDTDSNSTSPFGSN